MLWVRLFYSVKNPRNLASRLRLGRPKRTWKLLVRVATFMVSGALLREVESPILLEVVAGECTRCTSLQERQQALVYPLLQRRTPGLVENSVRPSRSTPARESNRGGWSPLSPPFSPSASPTGVGPCCHPPARPNVASAPDRAVAPPRTLRRSPSWAPPPGSPTRACSAGAAAASPQIAQTGNSAGKVVGGRFT